MAGARGGMSERLDLRKVLAQARQQIARTAGRVDHEGAPTVAELAPHFSEFDHWHLLGVGGMGSVFRVRDRRHARDVAVKVLSRELASDPAFEERFNREARALGQLDHPNIVRVFDSGRSGPWLFLVMEYVDGVDLRRWLDLGGFTSEAALALLPSLCEALRHAHERGIVHRDIKPENILIDEEGVVKLADFGLVKIAGEADWGVTRTNQALGTVHYMAPEQLDGASDVDHRADIFSLGVVVYEMLTGQLPRGRFELPSEKEPGLSGVDRVVLRSMERDPAKRYQSATEFERDLHAGRQSITPARRRAEEDKKQANAPILDATVAGWAAFALSAIGLLVTMMGFIYARGLMLPAVGIGLVTMAIGMVLGFAALRRATRASTYVWLLAASFGACVPAGFYCLVVGVWLMISFRVESDLMQFGFLLVVLYGTLSWVVATARSGDPLWLWRRRSRDVRGSQRTDRRGRRPR
jgi:hypothetical protein